MYLPESVSFSKYFSVFLLFIFLFQLFQIFILCKSQIPEKSNISILQNICVCFTMQIKDVKVTHETTYYIYFR